MKYENFEEVSTLIERIKAFEAAKIRVENSESFTIKDIHIDQNSLNDSGRTYMALKILLERYLNQRIGIAKHELKELGVEL